MTRRARKLGQRSTKPLPLSMLARAMTAKWWIGFTTVNGCNHLGIASTGFSAPAVALSGGLMKKAINWACWADLAKVAFTVPMLMPDKMHRAAPKRTSGSLSWKGTPNTSFMTATDRTAVRDSRTNSGTTFAMIISEVVAGDIKIG